jgi:hypothetical protein
MDQDETLVGSLKPSKTLSGLFHFERYNGAERILFFSKKDPEENPGTSSHHWIKKFFLIGESMKALARN